MFISKLYLSQKIQRKLFLNEFLNTSTLRLILRGHYFKILVSLDIFLQPETPIRYNTHYRKCIFDVYFSLCVVSFLGYTANQLFAGCQKAVHAKNNVPRVSTRRRITTRHNR
jgi:hypothetical protein